MTPHIVPGWNPLGEQPATSDDQIFELLSAAVFQARFRPAVVRQRWPHIRAGFAGFHLVTVAAWPDAKLPELMQVPGMIRNEKKIRATLRNARDLAERSRQHGSALAYLRSLEDDQARVRDIDSWAHYIGAPSIRWFVRSLDPRRPSGDLEHERAP